MARDDGGAAGAVIVAFVLGAVTGAVAALMMAPATGDEVRRKIGEKAREGRDKAEEAARQGRDFVDRHKSTVISAVERGREAYQQARGGAAAPRPEGSGGESL